MLPLLPSCFVALGHTHTYIHMYVYILYITRTDFYIHDHQQKYRKGDSLGWSNSGEGMSGIKYFACSIQSTMR